MWLYQNTQPQKGTIISFCCSQAHTAGFHDVGRIYPSDVVDTNTLEDRLAASQMFTAAYTPLMTQNMYIH
jgi:hypothetical protein